jgi:phosphoribosyl 1,2-cyclic phosphodiesterase
MCKIIFLGSGGGRFNLIKQFRSTGGFLIYSKNLKLHVDPGPGAIFQLNKLGINPLKLDGLIITHNHIDHYLEAPLIIEAISQYAIKKRGFLITAKSLIKNNENDENIISSYHQNKLEKILILEPEKELNVFVPSSNSYFKIKGVPTMHEDKFGFGFVLSINNYTIAYTSDTQLLESEHPKFFANVDVLIANCLKPHKNNIPGHLDALAVEKLLIESKPKVCILTHLGMAILKNNPSLLAKKIQSNTSIKTIAAMDGYYYDLKTSQFKKFLAQKSKNPKKDGQLKLF